MTPVTSPAAPSSDTAVIRHQRRFWERRARSWDHGGATGLGRVVEAAMEAADPRPGMEAVDLGSGTGQLTLPVARRGAKVTAVDVSDTMVELLVEKARAEGLRSVTGLVCPIERLTLPPGSADLVVSCYALHHLRDRDKEALVREAAGWLRPGGRLVVADMMFGRGATSRDRAVIESKVATMLRRGPAGWWRLAKNVVKFTFRVQERPVPLETWVRYFRQAGLVDVSAEPVVAEAAVAVGTKP